MSRFIPSGGFVAALACASSVFGQAAALTTDEILALLPGKVLTYRSEKRPVGEPTRPTAWVPRTDGSHSIVQFFLRRDRSVTVRCTFVARDGASHACAGIAANDVGVWSVESDTLCLQWLTWNSSVKRCYRLRREAEGFRAEQVSGGASSMDGTLVSIK